MLPDHLYFIIVHWGDKLLTRKAVLSVIENGPAIKDHVVVVENGDESGLSGLCTVIKIAENRGYAAGVNAGIKYAISRGGIYFLVMNNDLQYMNKSAEIMMKKVEEGFDCVGGCVSEGWESPVLGGGYVDWLRGRTHFLFNKKHLSKISYISGAFFLITKDCFNVVGPMPEEYFHTWEDVAWSFRMTKIGKKISYAETPVIPHLCSQSMSEGKLKTYYLVRNGAIFVREYAPPIAKNWLIMLEYLRIVWSCIKKKQEVLFALLDAKKGATGKVVLENILKRR